MDALVKEATEHKHEKQELLNKMEMIGGLDDQLRLSKENFNTYVNLQAEADNIKNILPNIVGNAINNNLERIAYDAEQELGTAAADGGNGSVHNHYGKLEFYVDLSVRTLPKFGVRNNVDLNITKLEKTLLLVSLMLEESQKSFLIQQDETNKLTK